MPSKYKPKDRTLEEAHISVEFNRELSAIPDVIYEKPPIDLDNPAEAHREERLRKAGEKKAKELGFL